MPWAPDNPCRSCAASDTQLPLLLPECASDCRFRIKPFVRFLASPASTWLIHRFGDPGAEYSQSDEMGGVSRKERLLVSRALRCISVLVIFTVGALYSIDGDVFHPHGNPLLYAIATSWLVSITVAFPTSAFFRLNPKLLPLARWENDGEVYDRRSVRAFRWVLLQSPLGWINPSLYLNGSRTDCNRLLGEMNGGEGVHWITGFLASILGVSYLVHDHAVYGYVMLLVRIPFDLYPIMLLRRNRGRVSRLLRRQPRTSR